MALIESFPTEILQRIFSHCSSTSDQKAIAAVCHRWAAVVQSAMLQRTCLRVSRGIPRLFSSRCSRSRLDLIGKRMLQKSNRPYACLSVEWRRQETARNMKILSGILDVCEERFVVQRLHLLVPCNVSLVEFFEKRQDWLRNIVELNVQLAPAALLSDVTTVQEVSLPNLKQLTWNENRLDQLHSERRLEGQSYGFALDAPELSQLIVDFDENMLRYAIRRQSLNICSLFQPTLELKIYPKLENVTITGLFNLSRSRIDDSERCLQNLTVLTFVKCNTTVVVPVCEKCPNLKELTIVEPLDSDMSLQISPTLSANLEHLTIRCVGENELDLRGKAVFPKLRSICLNKIDDMYDVSLIAPQLTTCNTLYTQHNQLLIVHTAQITTLKVQLGDWIMQTVPPPQNVTELFLRLSVCFEPERSLIQTYLQYFPNLTLLSICEGLGYPLLLDCAFLAHLPQLQHFSVYKATIRLADVEKFARLKSLVLSHCILEVKPSDDQVSLTAVEYVRVYRVKIDGVQANHFPFHVNERQTPIEMVQLQIPYGRHAFSSKYFNEPTF